MITSICHNTVKVTRQSNKASDSVTVDGSNPSLSIGASSQPERATALSFKFSDRVTGSITISGSLNGSSQTEEVSISNNKISASMKRFDQVDTIAFDSSITDDSPSVTVKYLDLSGSAIPIENVVIDGFPINLSRKKSSLVIDREGSNQYEVIVGIIPYTEQWTPREFDLFLIKETTEQFLVVGVPRIEQIGINMHWSCNLKRYERT
jgi:hypothetical protein